MKAIKLIIVFALILGGVIAAFYFATRNKEVINPPFSSELFDKYRTQFEDDWKCTGDWDEDVFESHCDLIKQLGTEFDVSSLNDLNTSTAIEVVYKHILDEWKNPTCKKPTIDNYIQAVSVIEKADSNAYSNPNVKTIREINEVYLQAYNLSRKNIGLTPRFNGSNWNSYSNYASQIESQVSSLQNNLIFKTYLSNIAEINSGLNEIPSKLSSGRSSFYNSLAIKIIKYYSQKIESERTRDDLTNLRNTISKYESEYGSNSNLSSFARSYAKDVNENEKNYETF